MRSQKEDSVISSPPSSLDFGKMEKNARFAVHADASFALRGFLSGMDGVHRKLPIYEIPAGNRTLSNLSHRCGLSEALPRIPIYGSRAIHVTRTLSEAARGVVTNRPLSPHLPIKKPQLSATYSISHRIFGASLASAILLIPIAWKFSVSFDV